MNSKSTLLACALFFACLTLAAQARMGISQVEMNGAVSSPYSFVRTARFDGATPLYTGSFERPSPLSVVIAGRGEFLLSTMNPGPQLDTIYSFVTTGFDLAAPGAEGATPTPPAISEPGTYALMALGLGVVAFSKRRRQSRAD